MDVRQFHRVLIVGLGSSGLAAARLAARDGAEVWVTDRRSAVDLEVEGAAGAPRPLPYLLRRAFRGVPRRGGSGRAIARSGSRGGDSPARRGDARSR